MIRVESLGKKFDNREIFHGINLTINKGDVIGIIGPSGTGKSTFLRCLMMLESPDEGKVYLGDDEATAEKADINKIHERIGFVFQGFNLFNHMTVIENVESGMLHVQNINPKIAFDEANKILSSVGLLEHAYEYPASLSNGQKQRAAIARTIAMNPEYILMDEPTSSLDPLMKGEVEAVIKNLADAGHTIVIVSHEMELIKSICNRVLFFNAGTICEEGSPEEIFEHPKQDATRRFIRALKVLEININSKDFDFIGMQTTISEFAFKNGIDGLLIDKLYAVMEELSQMFIIQTNENHKMQVSLEYNRLEKSLDGTVLFSGPKFDEDDPAYFISWPIVKKRASDIKVSDYDADGFTNVMNFKLL